MMAPSIAPAPIGPTPGLAVNGSGPGVAPLPPQPNQIDSQLDGPITSSPSAGVGSGHGSGVNSIASQYFTKAQLAQFRLQVRAFQLLSSNQPLPPALQESLFHAASAVKAEGSAGPILSTADGPTVAAMIESTLREILPGQPPFHSTADPRCHLPPQISYALHSLRERRPLIPSLIGAGFDLDRLVEERDNIVYNRIQTRKAELENLPANIGAWDTALSDQPCDNANLKLKALIELKKLTLLPKQRQLRQAISREVLYADSLAMTANRLLYRRLKKPQIREAQVTDKLEKQQRDVRESKEKQKHNDFISSIFNRAQEMRAASVRQSQRLTKLGQIMLATHVNCKKDEEKRVERTAKQRLQALKANDEETYLKLLGQAKDTRISHLLKQTDGFLKQLAASVKQQQRGAPGASFGPQDEMSDAESGDSDDEQGGRVDYYDVAHRIKEEITAQSSNLVGGTLKEYQLKGLQWMISLYNNNLNGILADEMGLGKTIQTISLVTYLIEKKKQPGPYLVLVPLSTLTNWTNEFEKWAPSVTKIVYKGSPNVRKKYWSQIRSGQFQVLLTTYEFVIKDRHILSKIKWLHLIVDEGHRMKNAQSKLSSTITQFYHTRNRLILTGTPLQNNLTELWAMLNFVLPNIFKSAKSFDEWFNTPFANTGGQDRMELTEEEQLLVIRRLHKVLRPFLLRRLKKDVEKDLPDKTERVIKCNFSALQAKLYKQLVTHQKLVVSDGKGGKAGVRGLSNMLMQLRKLCNHPFVFEAVENQVNPQRLSNDLLWRTSGKFELLDRILPKFKATGHRILIFFQMTQIMDIMEDFLRFRGYKYLRLDGSTKADDRSDMLKVFNAPNSEYFCFLLSTRAGGLGLNLQTADTVIIYDSDWNPHQDLQAQDRAHRIGQKNEVRILRLITSNSVEEKILERANFKLDMDGKVIQAGKFDNKSTNEERDAMLRVMLESAEAADSLEQEEMDDDDLNMIMMRSDDEFAVFQAMDAERAKTCEYGPDKPLPRLMAESELPDIYLNEDVLVEPEKEQVLGRGARERTVVKYDDGLTEEQWLEAVDDDNDTIEDAIRRKQERIETRLRNKAAREAAALAAASGDAAGSAEAGGAGVAASASTPKGGKRGRRPKADKRKADEAMLDSDAVATTPQPPRKRGRQAKLPDPLSPENRAALQKVLSATVQGLEDLVEEVPPPEKDDEDEGGDKDEDDDAPILARGIIDPFLELPGRQDYPDYFVIIKQPVCMSMIQKKIDKKQYLGVHDFLADVTLMCNNCRTYNEDTSVLYQDANLIEETCVKLLNQHTRKLPQFWSFDGCTNKKGDELGSDGEADEADAGGDAGADGKEELDKNHPLTPTPTSAPLVSSKPSAGSGTATSGLVNGTATTTTTNGGKTRGRLTITGTNSELDGEGASKQPAKNAKGKKGRKGKSGDPDVKEDGNAGLGSAKSDGGAARLKKRGGGGVGGGAGGTTGASGAGSVDGDGGSDDGPEDGEIAEPRTARPRPNGTAAGVGKGSSGSTSSSSADDSASASGSGSGSASASGSASGAGSSRAPSTNGD